MSLDRRRLGMLAAGHGAVDLCQGAVPALLPFLIAAHGLSLASATALLTAATIGSSIVQPLFGLWADRLSSPLLLPFGLAAAGLGLGAVGFCDSYMMLAAALFVSGLGVAAFHPEAARLAGAASGDERGKGMSYFSVGGNLGFALGPLLTAPAIAVLGLDATPLLAIPGLALAVVTARRLPALAVAEDDAAHPTAAATSPTTEPAQWWPFARLIAAAVSRTGAFFALLAFIPVWVIHHFDGSTGGGDAILTVMLVFGALGTLIGGRCADRFGRRSVLVTAMAPLALLLLALPHVGLVPFVVLVAAIGFTVDGPFSTTVVLGQEYLPGRHGLASGVTLGLAIGLGGLVAAGLGALADATSLGTTMAVLPVMALVALASAVSLPEPARAARRA
ncbi:Fosmidomycin resistance protein [Baekduia alba]|uniref:MFS transporter n=1 Tax=Baekduia alba TaxID=2997333 RepID=UPI0023425825|nr:MFS transporter [Baekduia alba]WCB92628.1 Fosmidomycin resistance protein [Baekduia alba]